MASKLGHPDVPAEDLQLGLDSYARALKKYVTRCDMPMTIALLGDWGTGKTTLMQWIKGEVESQDDVAAVWFNTWQFGQFSGSELLPIFMMQHFADQICPRGETAKRIREILSSLASVGPVIARLGLGALGLGSVAPIMIQNNKDVPHDPFKFNPASQIVDLKARLAEGINEYCTNHMKDRIVVFIDDLDRVLPENAVELLACVKLFLDVPRCVFVLACDHKVLMQGLKQRFTLNQDELARRFFDKLIQLQFNMPISRYKVDDYVKALLMRIPLRNSLHLESHLPKYVQLVRASTGNNPRAVKRVINAFELLLLTVREDRSFPLVEDTHAKRGDKLRIVFAMVCMQQEYPALYGFLANSPEDEISDELFNDLSDEASLQSEQFSTLWRRLKDEGRAEDEKYLERMCGFVTALRNTIQLYTDNQKDHADALSPPEIATFCQLMHMSGVVGVTPEPRDEHVNERRANIRFARQFERQLNERYHLTLEDFEFTEKGHRAFHAHQWKKAGDPRARIELTFSDSWGLRCEFSEDRGLMHIWSGKRKQREIATWVEETVEPALRVPVRKGNGATVATIMDLSNEFPQIPSRERKTRFKEIVFDRLDDLMPLLTEYFDRADAADLEAESVTLRPK